MTQRTTEVYTDRDAFIAAQKGAKRAQRAPSGAPKGEGDRHAALMRLAAFGVSMRFDSGVGFYGWNAQTGWHSSARDDYASAVAAAEEEVSG
jgi:hypothetical protein